MSQECGTSPPKPHTGLTAEEQQMTDTTRRRWVRGSAVVLALALVGAAPMPPEPAGLDALGAEVVAPQQIVDRLSSQHGSASVARPQELVELVDRLDSAQGLEATGSLADTVAASALLERVEIEEPAPLDLGTTPPVAGLPRHVTEPIERLQVAVTTAAQLAEEAAGLAIEELTALGLDETIRDGSVDRLLQSVTEVRQTGHGQEQWEGPQQLAGVADAAALYEWRRTGVSVQRYYQATLLLARTIDQTLPQLLQAAQALPPSAETVDGCDLVDHHPDLCIGGTGGNNYTRDYALLIDLGGDDLHANSAGGAHPAPQEPGLVSPGGNGLYASVLVDLAGEDHYGTTLPTADGSEVAIGAGLAGGIGVLVDAGGSDRYAIEHTADGRERSPNPRGIGSGALGVGFLADLAGDDNYSVRQHTFSVWGGHDGTDGHPDTSSAQAHGAGVGLLGVGILTDALGDDRYLIESAPQEPLFHTSTPHGRGPGLQIGQSGALGFGAGLAGGGLFIDSAGTDDVVLRGATAPVDPDDLRRIESNCPPPPPKSEPREYSWACYPWTTSLAYGFGLGYSGTGTALFGPGDATYSLLAEASAPETHRTIAWGFGASLIGAGAVVDVAGDDDYLLSAENRRHRHADATGPRPAVAQDNLPTQHNDPTQWMNGLGGGASAQGMAYATIGAAAMIDGEGNDTYTALADTTAVVAPHASNGTAPEGPLFAEAGTAQTLAQGVAAEEASALLEDGMGDDVYEVVAQAVAEARGGQQPGVGGIEAYTYDAVAIAQGAIHTATRPAYAELHDGGGHDRYSATCGSAAVAEPDGRTGTGTEACRAQGSVNGVQDASIYGFNPFGGGDALLIDLGADGDIFQTVPTNPACVGARGDLHWIDCTDEVHGQRDTAVGLGVNQPAGAAWTDVDASAWCCTRHNERHGP